MKYIIELEMEERKDGRWSYNCVKSVGYKTDDDELALVEGTTKKEGEQLQTDWHIEPDQNTVINISTFFVEEEI